MTMKAASLALVALLLAGLAQGQNLSIAKDQARRASGQSSPQAPASQPPGAAQPPPADPALVAMQQNIARLRADLTAINAAPDAKAAGEQRISLLNNLSAAAQGTKASSATARKLAGDLIAALPGRKKLSPDDSQKFARALRALFNGKNLSAAQQETQLNEVKKILTDAEVPAEDITMIEEDLKAAAAETK
jgi:hypothetical protein